jgi:hypothetical protein
MNTEQIKQTSRAKYLHSLARQNLREKYQARLLVTMNGGTWRVTPELIAFLSSVDDKQVVLIDIYENPCLVDRLQLLEQSRTVYSTIMMEWYDDNEKINRQR